MNERSVDKSSPLVSVRGLRVSFGGQDVLRGVDVDVFAGETLCILGHSGGGKSVLIKHMAGLMTSQEGEVWIGGERLRGLNERQLARLRCSLGFMFQNGALFDSMSVAENCAFGLVERGGSSRQEQEALVTHSLKLVGLEGQEDKMPAELSGGMKKRVAIARAIITKPRLVFYDEPHAGLDPVSARVIDSHIRTLQRELGMASVIITHEIKSAFRLADRILFLYKGKVYWEGSVASMQESKDSLLREFL